MQKPTRIAIFASGAGSNAHKLIAYFASHPFIHVQLIATNNNKAGVIQIAQEYGINVVQLEKDRFFYGDAYIADLAAAQISYIVLAGFLWKVPEKLVHAYPDKIINIHPALLPKYGGKGMYGYYVHAAVIANGEKESGITIHLVDSEYDHGAHLFQAKCPIEKHDTPKTLAQKIHALEHKHFSPVVEKYIVENKIL